MNALQQAALSLLLQSTTLLLPGLLVLHLTRRQGPAVQTLVGRATLAGVAMLLLSAPLSGRVPAVWRIPTPTQASAPPETGRAGVGSVRAGVTAPASTIAVPDRALPAPARVSAPTPTLLDPTPHPSFRKDPVTEERGSKEVGLWNKVAGFWALISGVLIVWLGVCQWHLTRLRRTAQAITSGPALTLLASLTASPPLLLTHPAVHSPFLAGLRRPALFLPATYESDFEPAALRAIFVHEMAHRDRRDNAWTLTARLLIALLWPQPLLWLLCRRLEQVSEDACDEAVLASNCPPRAYADCLLTLAERHAPGYRQRTLSAGITPIRSSLGRRVEHILRKGTRPMFRVSPHLRLTIAALSVIAALGGAGLVSSAPADPSQLAAPVLTPQQRQFHAELLRDKSNLHEIALAIFQYAQDHNYRLPDANRWMDEIAPYRRDLTIFYDPFQPGQHRYAYAFNRNCSQKSLAAFDAPAETVMLFDSSLGTRNAADTGESLRGHPVKNPGEPVLNLGSVFCFEDGHTKWFRPEVHPSFSTKGGPAVTLSGPKTKEKPDELQIFARGNIRISGLLNKGNPGIRLSAMPDRELSQAQFLAGLTAVQGPGVIVTLTDSKQPLPAKMPTGLAPPNRIHDSDINAVVNELKAAGAEAISVNDQRLVATSSIRTVGPVTYVNGAAETGPFLIKAIGNAAAMTSILREPHSIAAEIELYDPSMYRVQEVAKLTLPAYPSSGTEPLYAKPVLSPGETPAERHQHQSQMQADIHRINALLTRLEHPANQGR